MDCSTSSIVSNQIVSSGATKTCKILSDLMSCYLSIPMCESLPNFRHVTPTWYSSCILTFLIAIS